MLFGKLSPAVSLKKTTMKMSTYPMRSLFFVKKTRKAMEKVKTLKSDIVILDLEDSIAKDNKTGIRELYWDALRSNLFDDVKVYVRSSSLDFIGEVKEDLNTFAGSGIEGFMLPKLRDDKEVVEVDRLLTSIEQRKNLPIMQTKLLPIIETLPAYFALHRIASASKRNVGIIGGSGDFTAESLCEDHSATYDAFFGKCVLAAKCAGILPLWGVHDKIDDHAGFYKVNSKMKGCGFAGTAALTPEQIAMANAIYSLTPREISWIQSVQSNGSMIKLIQPSVQESRQMIGPPHYDKASNLLKQYPPTSQSKRGQRPSITGPSKGLSPTIKMGEVNFVPDECTITDGMISMWNSSFLQYSSNKSPVRDTKNTLCQVPFSFSTTLAVALSVQSFSYHARAHLGFKDIFQVRPIAPGDVVRGMFRIDDVLLKKGGDGNSYAIAKSKHWLVNQEDKVVLQLEKATMFHPDHCTPKLAASKNTSELQPELSILFNSSLKCDNLPLKESPNLSPGGIIFHDIAKVMGHSEVRMLCSLLKIVNPHHHNKVRYNSTDILVPGPFVMAAALSSASADVGNIVYEEIPSCVSLNKVNLGDQIGTMTFVEKCSTSESNPNLEEVLLKHVAIKNTDMMVLTDSDIPQKLFSGELVKPSEYEALCIAELPHFIHKIACTVTRRIIRIRSGLSKVDTVPQELL